MGKKCSGKATGVELEDGMYVMDLIIRKGKVTIAKCDKEEGPAPTGPGTGGSGNGGEGSGSGTAPPTGSGSGSGPAPPTGSGSGSEPGSGSGSGQSVCSEVGGTLNALWDDADEVLEIIQ